MFGRSSPTDWTVVSQRIAGLSSFWPVAKLTCTPPRAGALESGLPGKTLRTAFHAGILKERIRQANAEFHLIPEKGESGLVLIIVLHGVDVAEHEALNAKFGDAGMGVIQLLYSFIGSLLKVGPGVAVCVVDSENTGADLN